MTKLYSPLLIQREQEYFIRYWIVPNPNTFYWNPDEQHLLLNELNEWQSSYKEVRVHPTQNEGFIMLAKQCWKKLERVPSYFEMVKSGIELPPENIEIRPIDKYVPLADDWTSINYAFLVESRENETPETEYEFYKKQVDRIKAKDQEELLDELIKEYSSWFLEDHEGGSISYQELIEKLKSKYKITKL